MSILHTAVTSAARDQPRLQSVAGRHVHVVYFDTVLAAVDILDDRAWDDLAHAWVQLSRATGALAALPLALSFRSWLEVLQGRLGSAASHLAEIEDVVSLTRSRGLLGAPAPAHVLRDAWLEDEEATRTGARRMMQDAHERGAGIGIDHAYAALSVLELGAGRYDAALRAARHIFDHDSIVLGTLALPDLVEAAARCSDMDIAEQALARLSERAAASGTPWARGLLARARALVANGDEADEHFRLALDELSRSTIATDTARTQLLYGEWLRRARRRKEAREPLHEALEFFETIGASGFAARARSELAATGEHVRSRSAPVNVLTPQEAQIARLAASGEREPRHRSPALHHDQHRGVPPAEGLREARRDARAPSSPRSTCRPDPVRRGRERHEDWGFRGFAEQPFGLTFAVKANVENGEKHETTVRVPGRARRSGQGARRLRDRHVRGGSGEARAAPPRDRRGVQDRGRRVRLRRP